MMEDSFDARYRNCSRLVGGQTKDCLTFHHAFPYLLLFPNSLQNSKVKVKYGAKRKDETAEEDSHDVGSDIGRTG